MRLISFLFMISLSMVSLAAKTVNVYVWAGEIPSAVIQDFENETGIQVNFSTFDSNETMYAKIKTSRKAIYDVIMPSGYFVERMKNQHLLEQLDHRYLDQIKNLAPKFKQADFDINNQFSIPYIWGATGIFYNKQWVKHPPQKWQDFWQPQWKRQLMLLDDSREVFAIALLSLGYQANDSNPEHIKKAYLKLLKLVPNIKLFANESIQAIMIDEDAILGSSWNADSYKAYTENKNVNFIYPSDGFVLWVDCLAMPKNPPHPKEAYQFINYMLRAEVAAKVARLNGHAITNEAGKNRLPKNITENKMIYPSEKTLSRAYFQQDVGEAAIKLYNQYWQQLKLAF
jgi:spermidine/putrescine transport system substrate-binding protein